MTKPHILIIMPDQWRGDCLGCAGHPVVQTPNIDRIGAGSMRFANAYTPCPICMPARSSFLSGLFCHNHGQWSNVGSLPANADTYLRHAKSEGYRTCHTGKSHLYAHEGQHLNDCKPFMQQLGWDDVLETTGPWATVTTDSIMTDHWREIGCLDTFRDDYRKRAKAGSQHATWPSPMPEGETIDDFVGRTAVDYINRYDRDEPLLMFVGFGGPHEPWDPPQDWAAKYDPARMDANKPPTEPPEWATAEAASHQQNLENEKLGITPEINGKIRSLYYAKMSHIDSWIGKIMQAMESRGMLDDTWIIFWSDHGEMLCDRGRLHKSVFYEESAHVPLLVRPPASVNVGGSVCERIVSIVDVFPTILDIAGSRQSAQVSGKSLMPLLADPNAAHVDAVFSEINQRTMIRDERYKMVVDSAATVLKLYDMQEDPDENVNLAGKPGTEDTVARLRERLLVWLLSTQWRFTHHPHRRLQA